MSHDPSSFDDDLDMTNRADAPAAPLGSPERARHRAEPSVGPASDWDLDLDPVAGAPAAGAAGGGYHAGVAQGEGTAEYEELVRRQLALLGEDPAREGILKTPARVAASMAWLTRGYAQTAEEVIGDALFAEEHRSMVLVRDIELYSMCEHHMLPFFGRAHIAYIPAGRIVGLSKLPRVVEVYARRLQVQERLTEEIAAALERVLRPEGVGVVLECQHLCMMMRGVEKQASKTITSALRGSFRDDAKTRDEFLRLAHAPY